MRSLFFFPAVFSALLPVARVLLLCLFFLFFLALSKTSEPCSSWWLELEDLAGKVTDNLEVEILG